MSVSKIYLFGKFEKK